MADKKNPKTPLGTELPNQQADARVEKRIESETPHGNAGGNAPIDANSLRPDDQKPLSAGESDGTGFTDTEGNTSAGLGGSIHNTIGGGNIATGPIGANEQGTRDLNRDVIPDQRASEVGGARGNQPDQETNELPGEQHSRPLPQRMQDATRERKAS